MPLIFPVAFWKAAGAITTIFTAAPSGSNVVSGYSIRNKCVTSGGGGTQVRVTFQGPSSSTYVVDHASIGVHTGTNANTVATPVELLFSGISGFSIGNTTIVSDWATLTVSSGATLVVIEDNNAGASSDTTVTPGGSNGRNYFAASATYANSAPGAGTADGVVDGVKKIEVQ